MIRRFVGAAAVMAAVFLPGVSQAQGVPGELSGGRGTVNERLARLGPWLAASLAAWLAG